MNWQDAPLDAATPTAADQDWQAAPILSRWGELPPQEFMSRVSKAHATIVAEGSRAVSEEALLPLISALEEYRAAHGGEYPTAIPPEIKALDPREDREGFNQRFKAATGSEATDHDWQEVQRQQKITTLAGEVVRHGASARFAESVPLELRPEVLQRTQELAGDTSQPSEGRLAGIPLAWLQGSLAGPAKIAEMLSFNAQARTYQGQLNTAAPSVTGSGSDPRNWFLHASEIGGMVANPIAQAAPATVPLQFAVQGGTGTQERLVAAGVDPTTAGWVGTGIGALTGIVFSKLPKQLLGKIDKPMENALLAYLANMGKVALETGAVNVADAEIEEATKYAAGVTRNPEFGKAFGEALKQTASGMGPLALVGSPQLLTSKIAARDNTPSRSEAQQLGIPEEQARSAAGRKAWFAANQQKLQQPPQPLQEQPNAQQDQKTGPDDGSRSPQPEVRQEDGNTTESSPGVQPGGQGEQTAQPGQQQAPQEAIGGQPDSAGVRVAEASESGTRQAPQVNPEITSIKNRIVDEIRAAQGAEPLVSDGPQSFRQWMDEAGTRMTADPEMAANLVDRINRDPSKPISEVEHAVLNIRYRQLQNRFTEAARAQAEAYDAGDEQAKQSAGQTVNQLAQQIEDTENAALASGTSAGRSLVSRKIELREDNSLAGLTYRARAAQDGKPLSESQQVQFTKLAEEYKQKEAAWQEQLAAQRQQIETLSQEKADGEVERQIAAKRQETVTKRVTKLVGLALPNKLDPDELRAAATRQAAEESQINEEYNRQLRGLQQDLQISRAKLEEVRNRVTLEPTGISRGFNRASADPASLINDVLAEEMPQRYPDLGWIPNEDLTQQILDLVDQGPKAKAQWFDDAILNRIADAMLAERGETRAPRGDAYEDPGGDFGDEVFDPASFDLTREAAEKPQPAGKEKPVSKRAAARQAVESAWDDYFNTVGRGQKLSANPIDPERLVAASKVLRAYIDLGVATFQEFLARVAGRLGASIDEERPIFAQAWEQEQAAGNVPNPLNDPQDNAEIGRLARKLTRWAVESGIEDREKVVDAVFDELKRILPDMTRRQAMDAISGYGEFKQLSKDETSVKIRGIKGELQQLAKLQDMAAGQAPAKTGIERREPTDEERRLIQQVNEAKKQGGFAVTDPEKQLKTALDTAKTAVRNRIADLQQEIDSREKIIDQRTALKPDQELLDLRRQRDELQNLHDEIFPRENKPQTPEQRATAIGRALDRAIEQLEGDLKAGNIGRKLLAKALPETPENAAKRARLDALRAQREELRANDPQYQADEEARQTAAYKRNLTARLADAQARLARGDFAKKRIRKTVLDKEAQQKKYELEQVNERIKTEIARLRFTNRTATEKVFDTLGKYRVAGVLSYPTVLVKLFGAAVARVGSMPAEEAVGGVLSKLPGLEKIAAQAPSEGGVNLRAHVTGIVEGITRGMQEAGHVARSGKSRLATLYGRPETQPASFMDFFGHIHAAMKTPVKQMAWRVDFEKRMQWYARQGNDVSDPLLQIRIGTEAYEAANRSIFMQDNTVSRWINQTFKARVDPKTGHASIGQKAKELAGKVLAPVIKVPVNIVGETLTYAFGTATGGAKILAKLHDAGWSFEKMTSELSPQDADLIMRHLKKGLVGSAFLLAGYLNPGAIGGYYQQGRKREEDEAQYGGVQIGGVNLPRILLHNPLLECLQLGATIRHVSDSYLKKHDTEPQGVGAGIMAAGLGLIEETPLARQILDVGKIHDPNTRGQVLGDYAKSVVVPGAVQQLAEATDKDSRGWLEGKRVERKPQSIPQAIESGIPGLRQTVPKEDFADRIKHKPLLESIRLYRDAAPEDQEAAKDRMALKYAAAKAKHKSRDPDYSGENWDKIQSAWQEIRDDIGNVSPVRIKSLQKRAAAEKKRQQVASR